MKLRLLSSWLVSMVNPCKWLYLYLSQQIWSRFDYQRSNQGDQTIISKAVPPFQSSRHQCYLDKSQLMYWFIFIIVDGWLNMHLAFNHLVIPQNFRQVLCMEAWMCLNYDRTDDMLSDKRYLPESALDCFANKRN